jgi:hypothetical protein
MMTFTYVPEELYRTGRVHNDVAEKRCEGCKHTLRRLNWRHTAVALSGIRIVSMNVNCFNAGNRDGHSFPPTREGPPSFGGSVRRYASYSHSRRDHQIHTFCR